MQVVVFWVVILYSNIFTLKMEAASTSERFVSCHNTIGCHDPEDSDLNLHRREILKTGSSEFSFPLNHVTVLWRMKHVLSAPQLALMRSNRSWCKLKHAQICLYCDQVAWLPLSSAIKSFRKPHSHTIYVSFQYLSIVDVIIINPLCVGFVINLGPFRLAVWIQSIYFGFVTEYLGLGLRLIG